MAGGPMPTMEVDIGSIFFGSFLGLFGYTLMAVVKQSIKIWKRTRSIRNFYLYMIWLEAIVNFVFALTTYLFVHGVIKGSLAYFTGVVILWAIQTQLLVQIIANRVALIMVNRRKSRILKWGLFALIAAVNVSVFCIWIPAQLDGASEKIRFLNLVFEKAEKSFFLLVGLVLNLYFLYLVRFRLISDGLTKYWPLFNFTAGIMVISVLMDATLLGLLSLKNQFVYVQFAPVAYIVHLHIELTMAILISKIVRASSTEPVDLDYHHSTSGGRTGNHGNRNHTSRNAQFSGKTKHASYLPESFKMNAKVTGGRPDDSSEESQTPGIMKTVSTVVQTESGKDSSEALVH